MSNYHDRLAAIRHKRIERRAGKALIHEEDQMLEYIEGNKVPVMIQHCVIKVMKKIPGNDKEKFLSAFNICSATFSKHGYTRSGGMQMTGKGIKRNREHQREKEASSKKSRYNGLVERLWRPTIKRRSVEEQKSQTEGLSRANNAKARLENISAQRRAKRAQRK